MEHSQPQIGVQPIKDRGWPGTGRTSGPLPSRLGVMARLQSICESQNNGSEPSRACQGWGCYGKAGSGAWGPPSSCSRPGGSGCQPCCSRGGVILRHSHWAAHCPPGCFKVLGEDFRFGRIQASGRLWKAQDCWLTSFSSLFMTLFRETLIVSFFTVGLGGW